MDEVPKVETSRCESELGSWAGSAWRPPPHDALGGLVERVWDFDGALGMRREQLFPSGSFELVVQLDEPHRSVDGAATTPFPAVCLDGLQLATSTIEAPRGRIRVLGIRLHPPGAFALIRAPLDDLTNRSVDLGTAIGRPAAELANRLEAARDGAARVRTAIAWLRARVVRAFAPDPIVGDLYARIFRGDARFAAGEIDRLEGRSRSRAVLRFRQQIGLAPKRYARVVRFGRALELLGAVRNGESLTSIALAAGFYDQAHMNADFREHALMSPRQYLHALRFPNSTQLALAADGEEAGRFFQADAVAIA